MYCLTSFRVGFSNRNQGYLRIMFIIFFIGLTLYVRIFVVVFFCGFAVNLRIVFSLYILLASQCRSGFLSLNFFVVLRLTSGLFSLGYIFYWPHNGRQDFCCCIFCGFAVNLKIVFIVIFTGLAMHVRIFVVFFCGFAVNLRIVFIVFFTGLAMDGIIFVFVVL